MLVSSLDILSFIDYNMHVRHVGLRTIYYTHIFFHVGSFEAFTLGYYNTSHAIQRHCSVLNKRSK